MQHDKKVQDGKLRLVLFRQIGQAVVSDAAPQAEIARAIVVRSADEECPAQRSEFQRDRDRIVHSTAFRRLEYKTQVFLNHEGDLFRTRLTHSLEVAQIARSMARALRLNEDLVEAISLAHDLGHTPFGHAGQDALNHCMREYGGFEHNLQSLRIVDRLEERYAAFDGLNLCFETREGIVKHCSLENARQLGELGERFLEQTQPSLEAQICNLADQIAYNNHDIDDGLRSGLITLEQMDKVSLFARHIADVRQTYPGLGGRRLIHETIRRIINALACDLIETTRDNLERRQPKNLAELRLAPPLAAFSPDLYEAQREMKRFLRTHLYRHYRVLRMTSKAQRIIAELFSAFIDDPRLLPPQYQTAATGDQARSVADYIAGMTDRYAMKEHRRLFAVGEI
ncbi:deoxyguanosinetriphosphate triphosphohydrolase [bacterium]|nr:deoxyguanosinetriphosphate triphosphohydrolase [bacterium]